MLDEVLPRAFIFSDAIRNLDTKLRATIIPLKSQLEQKYSHWPELNFDRRRGTKSLLNRICRHEGAFLL